MNTLWYFVIEEVLSLLEMKRLSHQELDYPDKGLKWNYVNTR